MKSLYEVMQEQNELQQIEEGKILKAIGRTISKAVKGFFKWLFSNPDKDKYKLDKHGELPLNLPQKVISDISTPTQTVKKITYDNDEITVVELKDKELNKIFDVYNTDISKKTGYWSTKQIYINNNPVKIKTNKDKNNKNSKKQNNITVEYKYFCIILGKNILGIITLSENFWRLQEVHNYNKYANIINIDIHNDIKSKQNIINIFIKYYDALIKKNNSSMVKLHKILGLTYITKNKQDITIFNNLGFDINMKTKKGEMILYKNLYIKSDVKENKHSLYSYYCRIVEELDDNLIWKLNKWFEMNEQQEQEFISILSAYKSNNMNSSVAELLDGTTLYNDIKTFVNFLYDDLDISSEKDYLYQFKKILDAVKNNKSNKNKYILY